MSEQLAVELKIVLEIEALTTVHGSNRLLNMRILVMLRARLRMTLLHELLLGHQSQIHI